MKYHRQTSRLVIILLMLLNLISATPSDIDNTLNELYENLLQREYAGPISFPDHQVERKAQRSPSLRLRFGRSDPDMVQSELEKRWLGDVNQKPIRSPSLRLRFGRRSDPMMPISGYDVLNNDYDNGHIFQRQERTPSGRLRWGRSLPENAENNLNYQDNQRIIRRMDNLDNNGGESESLIALLNALIELNQNSNEFNREIRKPLRLRWGRSTSNLQDKNAQKTVNAAHEHISSSVIVKPNTSSSSPLPSSAVALSSTTKG